MDWLTDAVLFDISESSKALITLVPACPIFNRINIQHNKTLEMLKIARLRMKRAMQSHEVYVSFRGKYHNVMLAEFKDFLISVKTALDSLAHELDLVFSITIPQRTISFNLHEFMDAIRAKDPRFAVMQTFCENGRWLIL